MTTDPPRPLDAAEEAALRRRVAENRWWRGETLRLLATLDAARASAGEPTADLGLDAAWAAAEAALPEGWRLGSLRVAVGFDGYRTSVVGWTATATEASGIARADPTEGYGPTPAAALLALAARLDSEVAPHE